MIGPDPLDDALEQLRQLALDGRIEVTIRADGRVTIERIWSRGFADWRDEADLEPGSGLPAPSEALRRRRLRA